MTYEPQLDAPARTGCVVPESRKLALVDADVLCDPDLISQLVLSYNYEHDNWLKDNFAFDEYLASAQGTRDGQYAAQLGEYLGEQLCARMQQYQDGEHSLECSVSSLTERRIAGKIAKANTDLAKAPALQRGFIADQIAVLESELIQATRQAKEAQHNCPDRVCQAASLLG